MTGSIPDCGANEVKLKTKNIMGVHVKTGNIQTGFKKVDAVLDDNFRKLNNEQLDELIHGLKEHRKNRQHKATPETPNANEPEKVEGEIQSTTGEVLDEIPKQKKLNIKIADEQPSKRTGIHGPKIVSGKEMRYVTMANESGLHTTVCRMMTESQMTGSPLSYIEACAVLDDILKAHRIENAIHEHTDNDNNDDDYASCL
jgi:hypothetical protein